MSCGKIEFQPVSFDDLPGWNEDDLEGALSAFQKSCKNPAILQQIADAGSVTRKDQAQFFQRHFQPHKVLWAEQLDAEGGLHGPFGFVTGYFEPVLAGARCQSERFSVPIYQRPPDLVACIDDKERAKFNNQLTYMRQTSDGLEPYPTRKEIEQGALEDAGLELVFVEDQVDAYFLHVQGSGLIEMHDGSSIRLTYSAKNGHPYSSIGKVLIDRKEISKEKMSLEAIQSWLRTNSDQARELMWHNQSFIFFEELSYEDSLKGPQGAAKVPLTPERSLAVDASIHALGTPIWVCAPGLQLKNKNGFQKLMIAQDVGSAIKGPERGDIYWGSGEQAGKLAGRTAHKAKFYVFLPKSSHLANGALAS